MKKNAVNTIIALLIIGFSIWLYGFDKAAEPGSLNMVHADISDCMDCHIPWQGVTDRMCLQCHEFEDAEALNPRIRFHTAEANCLHCHSEHRGTNGNIAEMNHTILNGNLACTACHYDPHEKLFGENCRNCHRISTWTVQGYRHPSADIANCNRCHRPPYSHLDPQFWEKIKSSRPGRQTIDSPKDCRRCHTTHAWAHLQMEHKF